MTVTQLIEELQQCDGDREVLVTIPSQDETTAKGIHSVIGCYRGYNRRC